MNNDLAQRLSDLYARNASLDQRHKDAIERLVAQMNNYRHQDMPADVVEELDREAEEIQQERDKLWQESLVLAEETKKRLQDAANAENE